MTGVADLDPRLHFERIGSKSPPLPGFLAEDGLYDMPRAALILGIEELVLRRWVDRGEITLAPLPDSVERLSGRELKRLVHGVAA